MTPAACLSPPAPVHIVFSPDRLRESPPPAGAFTVVVRYARPADAFADCCERLRDLARPFHVTWVDRGGCPDDPAVRARAEALQAAALAVSLTGGTAREAVLYQESVRSIPLQ